MRRTREEIRGAAPLFLASLVLHVLLLWAAAGKVPDLAVPQKQPALQLVEMMPSPVPSVNRAPAVKKASPALRPAPAPPVAGRPRAVALPQPVPPAASQPAPLAPLRQQPVPAAPYSPAMRMPVPGVPSEGSTQGRDPRETAGAGSVTLPGKASAAGAGSVAGSPPTGAGGGGRKGDGPAAAGATGRKYQEQVRSLIEAHKHYPLAAIKAGLEGRCRRKVVIARDGTVQNVERVSSCGHPFLDAAADREIRSVGKFPPLPEEFAGDEAGFEIVRSFKLNQLPR